LIRFLWLVAVVAVEAMATLFFVLLVVVLAQVVLVLLLRETLTTVSLQWLQAFLDLLAVTVAVLTVPLVAVAVAQQP